MPYYVASYAWNRVTKVVESEVKDIEEAIHAHPSGMLICATILAVNIDEAREIAKEISKKYRDKMRAKSS